MTFRGKMIIVMLAICILVGILPLIYFTYSGNTHNEATVHSQTKKAFEVCNDNNECATGACLAVRGPDSTGKDVYTGYCGKNIKGMYSMTTYFMVNGKPQQELDDLNN